MFSSSNSREWNFLFLRIPGNDNKPTLVWNCLWNLMLDVQFFFALLKFLVFHHSHSVQFHPHRDLFLLIMTVPKPLVQAKFFEHEKSCVCFRLSIFCESVQAQWLGLSGCEQVGGTTSGGVDKFLQSAARSKLRSLKSETAATCSEDQWHFGSTKWLGA